MNDPTFPQESAGEPPRNGDTSSRDEIPQFGAVDIVEAFTAMRHEWRGQTKESRAVAEQMQAAAANFQSLESRLLATIAEARPDDDSEIKRLVLLIVETDHQLTRAIGAIEQWDAACRQREAAHAKAVEQCVATMNGAARWFARHLLMLLAARSSAPGPAQENPALEGLNMVLARLRRMMREQGLERLDVLGQPFDANTMHAIGAVASTEFPAGHVAEQLFPAYRWQGRLLRFADVRVAN